MSKSLSEFAWGHLSRLPKDVLLTVSSPEHDRLRAVISSDRIPNGVFVLNSQLDQFEVALARTIVLFQGLQSDLEYLDMTWDEYSAAMPKKREPVVSGVVSENTLKTTSFPHVGERS